MSQLTHYPESASGPRERIVPVDCVSCHGSSEVACDCCSDPICHECAVVCERCQQDNPHCFACAIRNGFVETGDDAWACEEHGLDLEEAA